MRFTKVKFKNLFSFGDYYSEVALDQDGIVFVRGVNKDDNTSNGSGKSSILDVFIWTLYGKPLKSIPADNIVNTHIPDAAGHGIVEFWIGSDYYEINRYRNDKENGNSVVIKRNGQPDETFTNGTNRDVQERIDALLGLDYFAFTSSIVFSSEIPFQIPKLTADKRRQYLEAILGLQAYSEYGKVAKNKVRNFRRSLEDLQLEEREKKTFLGSEKSDLDSYTKLFNNYSNDKHVAVEALKTHLLSIEKSIASIDLAPRVALEKQIATDKVALDELKQSVTKNTIEFNSFDNKHDAIKNEQKLASNVATKELNSLITAYEKSRKLIQSSISLMQQECPSCKRGWETNDVHSHTEKYEADLLDLKKVHDAECLEITDELSKKNIKFNEKISENLKQRSASSSLLTTGKNEIAILDKKIDSAKAELVKQPSQSTIDALEEKRDRAISDISNKSAEQNPYKEVIDNLHLKINDVLERMEAIDDGKTEFEEKLKYATFWDESFNNDGLKLFIFETVIPLLNSRIGHYLPLMFDGKDVKILFDKMMNMNVLANGKPLSYGGMSQGERKRIDLSIALALLDTAQAQHGVISNVMFFDEIFDSSLDTQGVKVVSDLLRSMPVQSIFVMSHRTELMDSFDSILEVEKDGKFSRIL
jgi:DNA repair exonuclease SbcCD ATPase subunit